MHIDIVYFSRAAVERVFGADSEGWYAFEVLDAERRGELSRVKTERTDEDDSRAFGSGRHWWEPIDAGTLVGFVDEDSHTFSDVGDFLWSPLVDDANPEECTVHVFRDRKPWKSEAATAKETPKGWFEAELRSPFPETAAKIDRLLRTAGYSISCIPWGRENALEFPGGVKVWAE